MRKINLKPHVLVLSGAFSVVIFGFVTNSGTLGTLFGLMAWAATQPTTVLAAVCCALIPDYRQFRVISVVGALMVAAIGVSISASNRTQLGITIDEAYQLKLIVAYVVSFQLLAHIAHAIRLFFFTKGDK